MYRCRTNNHVVSQDQHPTHPCWCGAKLKLMLSEEEEMYQATKELPWDAYALETPRQEFIGTFYATDRRDLVRDLEEEHGRVAVVPAA